ncbi:FAD-dependent monooxygenase [Actinoallomurus sp. CA-142502]|uniref:FAD-dependent monooxygenase n=1 Tax=Actinoallomurus sp. CA-142502 TaxID=3239885 RepID=UPI003D8DFCDC
MTDVETEVVIAGAGPTGLTLAYELALAGVETLVLEKLPRRVEQVKGGAIQPRTAELLEMRGLLKPLLRRAMPRDPVGGHFAMLPVPLDCTPWQTRHPYPITIPQWEIEEVLEERAAARGARIRRGAAVDGVENGDGVTVSADGLRVRARHLVACDGGRSTVRKLLGLPFPGRPGTYLAVLADVRLSATSSLVPRRVGHISGLTRQANGYWAMLVPVGGDRYRLTFGREDETEATRDTPVTREEIAAALRAVYGEETVLGEVDNASRFTDATRQVEHYRVGDVLFAGDAAHIHPPLGGQGLNTGVQDAVNLGWKLAATVQGRAPEGLLDTYHAERHPVAAGVLHHTSAQRVLADPRASGDVAALRDIVIDLLRLPDANRHLAGLMSGLSLRYDLAGEHPLTGHRMPDADLLADAGPTRVSALFRAGHAVLLDLAGIVPSGLRLPADVDLVRAGSTTDLGAAALLVRPDGYVCWAADDAATLLPAVARHLATVPTGMYDEGNGHQGTTDRERP